MKVLLTSVVILASIMVISCSKKSTPGNPGSGSNSLFPLTQNYTWYYADSAFSDSVVTAAYLDTMTVTKNAYQDNMGLIYLELNDPYGWFFGSYINVDPSNTAIYEVDSPYFQSYTFFAVPQTDGQVIGTGTDNTNPACPLNITQWGWVTPDTVAGFSCLKNIEYAADCNGNPQEQIDTYISKGVGVVRIVHYLPDSTSGNLHEDFSQTLRTYTK